MTKHIHIYMPKAALGIRTDDAATVVPGQVRVLTGGRRSGKSLVTQAFRDAGFDEGKVKRDEGGKFSASQHTAAAEEHSKQAAEHASKAHEAGSVRDDHRHRNAEDYHTEAAQAHTEAAAHLKSGKENHPSAAAAHAATKAAKEASARTAPKTTNRDIGKEIEAAYKKEDAAIRGQEPFTSEQHHAAAKEHHEQYKRHEAQANTGKASDRKTHQNASAAHYNAANAHAQAGYAMHQERKDAKALSEAAHAATKNTTGLTPNAQRIKGNVEAESKANRELSEKTGEHPTGAAAVQARIDAKNKVGSEPTRGSK